MLAGAPPAIRALSSTASLVPRPGGLLPAGPVIVGNVGSLSFRLKDMSAVALSDLLVAEVENVAGEVDQPLAIIAADTVAQAPTAIVALKKCTTLNEELALLRTLIQDEYGRELGLVAAGPKEFFARMRDRLAETVSRVDDTPGFLMSRLAAEWRQPLNDFATLFVGDVLTYLRERDRLDAESIPHRVMTKH